MAYIVGVLFNALVFVGLPLEYLAGQTWVAAGWTAHGFVYVLYLLAAFMLTRRLGLSLRHTLTVLLAGTIPIMTFVVERWVTRRFLSPASPASPARPGASEGPPAASGGGAAGASAGGPAGASAGGPPDPAQGT